MTNRLAKESSPYLHQHADNPVDWYPWGEEALAKAKAEDKPIFLSIGYSACHWCHVMAHESFENEQTAAVMNEHFINIKVDREERPDIDSIYMDAVVSITGQGGWPMSVFLSPDGVPFYGGTYFPPTPRHGSPSFEQILTSAAQIYQHKKDDITKNGAALMSRMKVMIPLKAEGGLDSTVPARALEELARSFDTVHGGFGGAPKFPQPMSYEYMLHSYHQNHQPNILEMAELTLQKMARGGIYDQLGGGFHRYSVDNIWLVPHFEKMLYDNALLVRLYLHAYQTTCNIFYRQIAEETLDYILREMTDSGGGFYSSQDADSEGEEGRFFVWTVAEIEEVLGKDDGQIFCAAYDVKAGGNFEGKSILNRPELFEAVAGKLNLSLKELTDRLKGGRAKLFEAREGRVKPGRDEKIITAWNGMTLAAFAESARVLNRPDYLAAAIKNAEFTLSTMMKEGRLFRTWKAETGQAKLMGYLEDYAFYAEGLLTLYQADFNPRWFQAAQGLMDTVLEYFPDEANGGFFDTASDHEQLVTRPKSIQDNAIPSGNSITASVLLKLSAYTGQAKYATPAHKSLAAIQTALPKYPTAFTHWLEALLFALSPPKEIAIIGQNDEILNGLLLPYRPDQVVASAAENETAAHPELVHNRPMVNGQATAYVCQNFSCNQPVTTAEELKKLLSD